jgi:hypothetical protein
MVKGVVLQQGTPAGVYTPFFQYVGPVPDDAEKVRERRLIFRQTLALDLRADFSTGSRAQ